MLFMDQARPRNGNTEAAGPQLPAASRVRTSGRCVGDRQFASPVSPADLSPAFENQK